MKKLTAALGIVAVLALTGCSGPDLQSELDRLERENATLAQERDDALAELEPQESVANRATLLEKREADLEKQQASLKKTRDDVNRRLLEVEKREKKITARDKDNPWIKQVSECLSRDGDYLSASVQWTEYGGLDFSCYTG